MPGDQIQFDANLGSTDRKIREQTGPSPSKNFKVFFSASFELVLDYKNFSSLSPVLDF